MTDVVACPTAFPPRTTSRARRFVALLRRSFEQAMMADETRRTLNELPDSVLRDLGVKRRDIPFVADALASSCAGIPNQSGVGRISIQC